MEVVCSQEEHNRGDTIDVDFTLYQGDILSNLAFIVDVNHCHQTKGLFVELLPPVSPSPFSAPMEGGRRDPTQQVGFISLE